MSHEGYHEPYEKLTEATRDMHRAIISLMEELEAIDWYQQRADVCPDDELRSVLLHNKHEEIEHAMMTLEWIRRQDPVFDENMVKYLFAEGPIVEIEESQTSDSSKETSEQDTGVSKAKPKRGRASAPEPEKRAESTSRRSGNAGDGSLGIGSLRG